MSKIFKISTEHITTSKYLCWSCLCKQTVPGEILRLLDKKNGYYNTQEKVSKPTLTFSCLLSSWCLCMKYWSLSCCLRSWCFSCRCRSSSSQNAASRAGKERKVGSGTAIPSHTSQPPGVCSEVAYRCILKTMLFHSKCFHYSSRLVMKVFDFRKWRQTIVLLEHQCLFQREPGAGYLSWAAVCCWGNLVQ